LTGWRRSGASKKTVLEVRMTLPVLAEQPRSPSHRANQKSFGVGDIFGGQYGAKNGKPLTRRLSYETKPEI